VARVTQVLEKGGNGMPSYGDQLSSGEVALLAKFVALKSR
jgi:mono/diheme cytochrome c family protein